MTPQIGNTVERIAKDYTGGRQGNVIEIDNEKGRARVRWTKEPERHGGRPMNLRTWVRFQDLKVLVAEVKRPTELIEGQVYVVLFGKKKEPRPMKYNGKDIGGNHCFVNERGFLRVAPSRLEETLAK